MSTDFSGLLASTLFGKTRRAVLGLLYGHPDEGFYLRQITRQVGLGQGAVQRELAQLVEAGLLTQSRQGNQVHFRANAESPIFDEMRSIIAKTAGAADIIRSHLADLASQIRIAFLFGSVAAQKDRPESDIDLMIVGDVSLKAVTKVLRLAEERLGREINPVIYPPAEYRAKLKKNHHFLKSLQKAEKIFLIRDVNELKRLGSERLASPS